MGAFSPMPVPAGPMFEVGDESLRVFLTPCHVSVTADNELVTVPVRGGADRTGWPVDAHGHRERFKVRYTETEGVGAVRLEFGEVEAAVQDRKAGCQDQPVGGEVASAGLHEDGLRGTRPQDTDAIIDLAPQRTQFRRELGWRFDWVELGLVIQDNGGPCGERQVCSRGLKHMKSEVARHVILSPDRLRPGDGIRVTDRGQALDIDREVIEQPLLADQVCLQIRPGYPTAVPPQDLLQARPLQDREFGG